MVKELWKKIKKGVKAGMAAVRESNELTDNRIVRVISEFEASEKMKWAKRGEQYYSVENDILNRRIIRKVDGKEVEESYKANNKLAHAKYKNQVDEKIAYLLSKPVTYKGENEQYAEKVKTILGKHFQHQLTELGYEATNKSIGWLHPYIDETGEFKTMVIPFEQCITILGKHFQHQLTELGYEATNKSIGWLHPYIDETGEFKTMVIPFEQCIPIWKDRTHLELTAFIRHYSSQIWENNQLKTITNVEVWTEEGVTYYRMDGKLLIYDSLNSRDEIGEVSHFKNNDTWQSWGKIPFIPFKNNWKEMPDIKAVKSLIDGYDEGRSEAANYVEDVKNLIFVLKGYGGTSLGEFMQDLNYYRAVKIDDPEDGGVDTITPTMDITAIQSHYEQLKRDIIEDGQSVNKDLDKYGNSPSGVALKFMYAGLDLKCNLLEAEFKIAFEMLLYFVDVYLEMKGHGNFKQEELELVFNRNITINETEAIQNCKISEGTISNKTILAHHPFVNDVEEELEAVKEQEEAEGPEWDKVPTKGSGVGEE